MSYSHVSVRRIKKYPNRRLYDTQQSAYITLSDIKKLVLAHEKFEVVDAKTSEDLTRSILLQIILEEETAGVPMFSTEVLAQMIRFYGHSMQGLMGSYLEKNLQVLVDIQARMQEQSHGVYEGTQFTPEIWANFMQLQAPMMQTMLGSYLDQSKNLFMQMQDKMQNQTQSMWQAFQMVETDKASTKV